MHGQPRGPLTLPEEVIQFETGRTTDNWCVLLDASNAQSFTHAQLIEHLEHIYGLETRWASTVAVRYEAERGIAREVSVPADLVAAMIFKSAARRRFEQLSRAEQCSLLLWLDEAADAHARKVRINALLDRLQHDAPLSVNQERELHRA
jgi:uncharacterized protein YdeI (YjbR/CyaY-like superfamily)